MKRTFGARRSTARRVRKRARLALLRLRHWLGLLGSTSGVTAAPGTPAVLIVDAIYPRPDRDSGSVDAQNFVRIFRKLGYQVFFFAESEAETSSRYRDALEEIDVHCVSPPAYWSLPQFLKQNGAHIDVCFLSRVSSGGRFIELARRWCPSATIIFNTVDLHHVRERRRAVLAGSARKLRRSERTRAREFEVIRQADLTIVVSSEEKQLVDGSIPGAVVTVVPLIRELPTRSEPYQFRRDIAFIGGYHHAPNVDAVHFFLDEIWPGVRARLPDVRFLAIGADMPTEISERRDAGFVPIGYVPDLDEALQKVRLTVAPLRYGAGAKGKVVASLAHGAPCIATPIAAEGMNLTEGRNILVGRSPPEIADLLVKAYADPVLWDALSTEGLAFVSEENSFDRGIDRVRSILASLDNSSRR